MGVRILWGSATRIVSCIHHKNLQSFLIPRRMCVAFSIGHGIRTNPANPGPARKRKGATKQICNNPCQGPTRGESKKTQGKCKKNKKNPKNQRFRAMAGEGGGLTIPLNLCFFCFFFAFSLGFFAFGGWLGWWVVGFLHFP